MKTNKELKFGGERALYDHHDEEYIDCLFLEGESAFKECSNISIKNSVVYGRYPFWHDDLVSIFHSLLEIDTRAALWYSSRINIKETKILGIKLLRESSEINIDDSLITSDEMLWRCQGININNSQINSVYFGFESKNIKMNKVTFEGKYSFQYVQNLRINNCILNTKDAFWHSKNVTIEDSIINGEYLAWYSEDITFINCIISGTQPICYAKNIKFINCTFKDGDRAFEKSSVSGSILGNLVSVYNPLKESKIIYTAKKLPEIIIDDKNRYAIDISFHPVQD